MEQQFDSAEHVRRLGRDLVARFDDARRATTPDLVGHAMEQAVRDHLGQILPGAMGVGSGCVIDTTGGTSRQMDVVVYERDLCPVFCVNNNPATTYYPCEGVVAVGEIKSRFGRNELRDAFGKIKSVKSLRREFEKQERDGSDFGLGEGPIIARVERNYGQAASSTTGVAVPDANRYEPNDAVLGFVLGDRYTLAPQSMLEEYAKLTREYGTYSPNMAVFLDGATFNAYKVSGARLEPVLAPMQGGMIGRAEHPAPFAHLIRWIHIAFHSGRTAGIAVFGKYMSEGAVPETMELTGLQPVEVSAV